MEAKTELALLIFKCRDAGHESCHWEGAAETEALLMFQIEQHALDHHNLIIEESGKEKIRAAIQTEAVAIRRGRA